MLKYQPKLKPLAKALSASKISFRSKELNALIMSAQQLKTLNNAFNESIPDFYKNKFQTNGIEGETLTLTCHSASLATRLRFDMKTIIKELNQRLEQPPIREIKIKIRPKVFESKHNQIDRALSKENAQLLLEEAEQTKDSGLREALVRLAQRSK